MILDCRMGSRSGSKQNSCEIGILGRQNTRTINLGLVKWTSPNSSDFGGLSAGCPAFPSVDSYSALVFAVYQSCVIVMAYSTSSNVFTHAMQFAILIILESKLFLVYFVFLSIKAVNSSVMSSSICVMTSLPNMQNLKLLMLCWRSFSWWGNIDVMHCFNWKGHHNFVYEGLPQRDSEITQDARPNIFEAPLTLMFRMGQGACQFRFCL